MTTWKEAAKRMEENFANLKVPPQDNQAPPQGNQGPLLDQTPVIPPPMTDREIRSAFVTLAQDMTT